MKEILTTIKTSAEDKKGARIRILDINRISTIADYFILITGFNSNQVQAIADHIEEEMSMKHDLKPRQIEGYKNAGWILMDYETIVVHVFSEENRSFYDLDRIWSDAEEIQV